MNGHIHQNRGNFLGLFAGVIVLLGGTYLIVTALSNAMQASDLEVLGGAFTLALLSFLLVYFVRPQSIFESKSDGMQHAEAGGALEMDEVNRSSELIGAD